MEHPTNLSALFASRSAARCIHNLLPHKLLATLCAHLNTCRDILNEGNLLAVAGGLPNSLQPFDFIPSSIGDRFNKDVAVLFGFDAVDK
jgi:hypothetical protein